MSLNLMMYLRLRRHSLERERSTKCLNETEMSSMYAEMKLQALDL
jgi:hypothetical protein